MTCSRSRQARASVISTSGSTGESDEFGVSVTVASCTADTCDRSRDGITWSSLLNARNADSPTPATLPPAASRRQTAMATASSGSSSSGGSAAPAPS